MAYIVVVTFDDETEAVKARQSLHEAQKHGYLELGDAVTVVKQPDGKVKVKDEFDKAVSLGAISGGFLGLLISSFFFPIMGLVLGAIGGGLVGKTIGMGVDKKFIEEVSEALQPGTSAIFLVVRGEYLNYMIASFEPYQGKIYHTSLPVDAEESLRAVLSERVGQLDNQMIALGFEGQIAANEVLDKAVSWQDHGIIKLEDAVVASRGYDDRVSIHQTKTLTGKYALKGGGIGLLAGLLLGGPVGGLVVGAAAGAVTGKRKDIGIDDHIIKDVSNELRPDTSVLFLMGKSLDPKRLNAELRALDALVITTSLSEEQHADLKKLLEESTTEDG
jgi:uncharacterized membrane protein